MCRAGHSQSFSNLKFPPNLFETCRASASRRTAGIRQLYACMFVNEVQIAACMSLLPQPAQVSELLFQKVKYLAQKHKSSIMKV